MTPIWSPESIHDLISLRAHIAEHDPAAAKRVALHILYCVEHLLSENPQLGNPGRVPERANSSSRKRPTSFPIEFAGRLSKSSACTTARAAGPSAYSYGLRIPLPHT